MFATIAAAVVAAAAADSVVIRRDAIRICNVTGGASPQLLLRFGSLCYVTCMRVCVCVRFKRPRVKARPNRSVKEVDEKDKSKRAQDAMKVPV